jgi:RNA polymerase sigma-70 factor (ECF subfamily)
MANHAGVDGERDRKPLLGAASSDAELFDRFRAGRDTNALEVLLGRPMDAAFCMACRCTRNASDAEDVVQATFFQVLTRPVRFEGRASFRSWLMSCIINNCPTMRRSETARRAREVRYAGRRPASSENPRQTAETSAILRQQIDELPERVRVPVWLRYFEEFSLVEIARTLRRNEDTVRKQVQRGLEILRQRLPGKGVTLSGAALITAIGAIDTETAPASLAEWLSSAVRHPPRSVSGRHASSRIIAHGSRRALPKALAAGGVVLAAALLAGGALLTRSDRPRRTPPGIESSPGGKDAPGRAPGLDARWGFEDGIPEDSKRGGLRWRRANREARGVVFSSLEETEKAGLVLPVRLPSGPFVVTVRCAGLAHELLGKRRVRGNRYALLTIHWLDGNEVIPPHRAWQRRLKTTDFGAFVWTVRFYFVGRHTLMYLDTSDQPCGVVRYAEPYAADRITVAPNSAVIDEIAVRALKPEEIRPEWLDPQALIASMSERPPGPVPASPE